MEPDAARERLATMVTARRKELLLSRNGAADLAEIHRHTWTSVERGTRRPRDGTQVRMERLLGWESGSIATILAGGDPTMVAPSATTDGGPLAVFARHVLVQVLSIIDLKAPPVPQVDQIHVVVSAYKNCEAELNHRARATTAGSDRDPVAAH